MAANLSSSKLSKSKFRNWLKAGLGVLFTKEGITPFVCEEIEQFQQKCLSDICNKNGLPSGSICSGCCTENVVVCPTNRICNAGRGKCTFHRDSATQYIPSGCPGNICHNFKKKVQNSHRYYGPSYRNTDVAQWCSNSWEVAKCFMPPDGYKDVLSAAETDFNGINSVIINFEDIQSKVQADLSKTNNIFNQGRDVGKAVRHSPDLEMEDTDLHHVFSVLENILSDPGYLAANPAAQNAKLKLSQLLNDELVIGKDDVRKVLDDAANVAQDNIRNEKEEYKKEAEKQKLELIKITNNSINKIEKRGQFSMSELDKALRSAVDEIEKQTKKSVRQLQAETGKSLKRIATEGAIVAEEEVKKMKLESDATVQKITSETDIAVRQVEEGVQTGVKKLETKVEEAIQQIREKVKTNVEEKYETLEDDLRKYLITFYTSKHGTILLDPLFENEDTPMVNFYVMPDINSIETEGPSSQKKKTHIKSLSDVFKLGGKVSHNIYLTADAGFGKTEFSKHLALTWCQAHKEDIEYAKYFDENDLKAMRQFELLFLVFLRHSSSDCSIDDMILNQIIEYTSKSEKMDKKALQHILGSKRHLVILDGLDEWNHPDRVCAGDPKSIPHRNARENCVILTTTRPWKLGVINLKTSQINKKIELAKLSRKSAELLKERAISKIKGLDIRQARRLVEKFNAEVEKCSLGDLESVPLLLIYLIYLWCYNIPLGQSRSGLYTSITELLLSRTVKKYPHLKPTCEHSQKKIAQCFRDHEYCKEYFSLLTALGRLAYHTLYSETRENTLVFDSSIAEKFLSESELKLSLKSGLITQSKSGIVTKSKVQFTGLKQSSKISFSHKSGQEYFSALYMSCQSESDVQEIIKENCKSLQDILDMSAVFVFISGMNGKMMSSISRELMSVISQNVDTIAHRSRCKTENSFGHFSCTLRDIQNMYISCIKENPDNNDLKLCLQDFFIDRQCEQINNKTTLQRLAKQDKNNIKSVCIVNYDKSSFYLYDKSLDSLQEIIDSFELTDLNHLQKLHCESKCKEADIIRLLSGSVKYARVESPLGSCSMTSSLCRRFQTLQQLEGIDIYGFEMGHAVLEEFLNYLTNRKSMKEIRLKFLSCTDHDTSCDDDDSWDDDDSCDDDNSFTDHADYCDGVKLDLSQHTELRTLVLDRVPLSQLNINVASLEVCDVRRKHKPGLASSWLSQLPAASKLNRLTCGDLESAGDIETLVQILPLLVHVKKVKLSCINLGERPLRLSPQMVKIEYVKLWDVTMPSSSFHDLVKHVEQLPHSVTVEIHSCTITPETECEAVKQYVRKSENFVVTLDTNWFYFVKSAVTTTTSD